MITYKPSLGDTTEWETKFAFLPTSVWDPIRERWATIFFEPYFSRKVYQEWDDWAWQLKRGWVKENHLFTLEKGPK